MNFIQSLQICFSKYVTFSGRARRAEYWWFVLFVLVVQYALVLLDAKLFGTITTSPSGFEAYTQTPVFSGLFDLAIALPMISVIVRRLHDGGRSGWWYWIVLIPIVGMIVLLVWLASKGTEGANRYGPDPLAPDMGDAEQAFTPSNIPHVAKD